MITICLGAMLDSVGSELHKLPALDRKVFTFKVGPGFSAVVLQKKVDQLLK
jgi:hypothetical protein